MPRFPKIHLTLALLVLGCAAAAATPDPAEAEQGRTFRLEHAEAKSALTFLRTIVGTRNVEAVDESTIRIEGTPEDLELAEKVVELLDRPAESEPGIEVHPLAGDEVLLGARLASASARDVMDAMRALGMPRVAVSQDPAPTIVVRCSRERVEVAAQRIRSLEGAGSE